MNRILAGLASVAVAAALAGGAPARADEHPDAHPDQHAPAHPEAHPQTRPAPRPVVHRTVVQHTTVVHRTVVNEHVNVVNRVGEPRWHRGDRFGGNRVVFNDWGRYHLRQPPAGYAWVQDGDELVLIALGTGLIDDYFLIPVP